MRKPPDLGITVPQSRFLKNLTVLASGTALAALVPLLASPLLARLYSPAAFGLLASFIALAGVLDSITTLRLGQAVMLPRSEDEAIRLVRSSFFTAVCITAVTALILGACYALGIIQTGWLLLIAGSMLPMGATQALVTWLNRKGKYKSIATARIAQACVMILVSLCLGVVDSSLKDGGMIIGWILGQFTAALILSVKTETSLLMGLGRWTPISFTETRATILEYRDITLNGTPALLISACATQGMVLLASALYGVTAAGYISFLERFSAVYMVIVGRNLADLLYRKLSEVDYDVAYPLLKKTLVYLVGLMFFGHLVLYFFFRFLLIPIFGEQWAPAATVGLILLPLWFIWAVFMPLNPLFNYYRSQKLNLLWQSSWLITDIAIFMGAKKFGLPFKEAIILYSIKQTILFGLGILLLLRIAVQKSSTTASSRTLKP